MSDREILLSWLASAAARLARSRRIRELGRMVCALVALRLLVEVLEIVGLPAPVRSAVLPLLIMGGLALLALLAWRLTPRTTLMRAALAADARADLKDLLSSAHWFARHGARDAYVEHLVARAARAVERLEPRRLFPMRVPRSVIGALALTVLTGVLIWFSPRLAFPVPHPGATIVAMNSTDRPAPGREAVENGNTALDLRAGAPKGERSVAGAQLETLTKAQAAAEKELPGQASGARNATALAPLLRGPQLAQEGAAQHSAQMRPHAGERSADEGSAAKPRAAAGRPPEAPDASPPRPPSEATARVRQQLSEQMREERRKLEGELAQGDVTPNNRLRAISRSSASQRKVNYAEGQAADAGARTTVDGTARGERTGKSRAGGSEGESPHSSPSSDADTQPVLGEQTVRLEAQLQSMRLAGNEERPPRQIEEAFYAASQRQASQVEHRAFASHWHKRSEAPLAQGQTPLAYREAVKQYFLSRHERDD